MLRYFAKYKVFGIFLFIFSVIMIFLIYSILKPEKTLPVYQPDMVNAELVDLSMREVRKYHTIADFKLINQNGDTITQKDYKGKIYVADFFFTTCRTICPIMTGNMLKIQQEIKDDPNIMLLSHTVTPKIDTVEQLKRYALKKGVIDEKWNLVTGDKKQIYELARKSYLAVKTNGDGGKYDMIHTENFVLVDKERRIRGFYDGTDPQAVKKLLKDIEILEREYQPEKGIFAGIF
ncbi:MAG TPA: SCO family protein [Salinimicrobium sp.]|nr:SCO family protein [Salinimicrobium sp.]